MYTSWCYPSICGGVKGPYQSAGSLPTGSQFSSEPGKNAQKVPSTSTTSTTSSSTSSTTTTGYFPSTEDYSRGDYVALPANNNDLENVFVSTENLAVKYDDNVFATQTATAQYAIYEFKNQHTTSTAYPTGTWIGTVLSKFMTSIWFLGLDWDTGQTTTYPLHIAPDKPDLELIRQIEDTEPGLLYEFPSTKDSARRHWLIDSFLYGYCDRYHRLTSTRSLVSQATFADDGSGLSILEIEELDPLKAIFNQAQVAVRPPATLDVAGLIVWSDTGTAPILAPGASRTFVAEMPTIGGNIAVVAYVDPWTTPVVGTDITQTGGLNANLTVTNVEKGTQNMTFTVNNISTTRFLTLTLVQARGTRWLQNLPTVISASDAASIATYGQRLFPLPPIWLPDVVTGQQFCDYIVSLYKDPHTRLRLKFVASKNEASMRQALIGTIGDRITIDADAASGLGINEDFYIENIDHAIDMGRTRHIVTYELVACSGEGAFWVLNTSPLEYALAHPTDPTTRLSY